MIHPGTSGCEVYYSLADELAGYFSCYGIDPYNLYNEEKILDLNKLADEYLSYIKQIMLKTNQESYYLFGFSFGGQIALEIASTLEKQGVDKITVILLDTTLKGCFKDLKRLRMFAEQDKEEYIKKAQIHHYDKGYLEKMLLNIEIENKIEEQKISATLRNTQIILFKAMYRRPERNIYSDCNNVDNVVVDIRKINVIKVKARHDNILNQEALITAELSALKK